MAYMNYPSTVESVWIENINTNSDYYMVQDGVLYRLRFQSFVKTDNSCFGVISSDSSDNACNLQSYPNFDIYNNDLFSSEIDAWTNEKDLLMYLTSLVESNIEYCKRVPCSI